MVSDKVFTTNGTQKIYSSDFEIISEDHVRVFLNGAVQSRDDYDLINNAAVFHVAPTTGQTLTLQVGTTPADILVSPTDAGIVAANIANVNTVAAIDGEVVTVAGIAADIITANTNSTNISTVATNITNVNNVGSNIADVTSVAANMVEVLTADTNAAAAAASAGAAATSETNAASSEASASTTLQAVLDLLDQLGDQWLGNLSTDPVVDNDGDPLTEGVTYWNTTEDEIRVYTGVAWVSPESIATTAASNAQTSAASSANSAGAAATSETNAANSASAASISETNIAGAEAACVTSETASANSAAASANSAVAAGVSETNAASSASSASTSAANAATSEANIAGTEAAVEALYDAFDDRMLGGKASDPSTDNDGNTLLVGTLYYNTTLGQLKIWNGTIWDAAAFSAAGTVTAFNTRTGDVSLNSNDIQSALGFDPQNTTEIEALAREEIGAITKDIKGFPNRTDSTIAFNETTREFSLAPTGASFDVYYKGELITISSTLTLTITNTSGARYVKINPTTQQLEEGPIAGHPSIIDDLLVGYIYWDAVNSKAIIFGEERHSSCVDTNWHASQHANIGCIWHAGGTVAYTLNNDDATISMATPLVIMDEDLTHSITHSATPSAFYEQVLEGDAQIPAIYQDDTNTVETTPGTVPWVQGTAQIRYNPITAGSGSLVDTPNNNYVSYWIVATNDTRYPVKAIMGHEAHSNVASAEAEVFDDYGFDVAELAPMYQVILRASTGSTYQCQIEAVYTLVSRQATALSGFSADSHGSLTGRSLNDQHPVSAITGLQATLDGKVDDAQVLTNVPTGAVFTDTVYTHPATHSITEVSGLQAALDGKVDDAQVLTNVPVGAVFTDTVYTHPATHSIAEVSGLQTALDGKALLAGNASQAFSASTLNATTVDLGNWTVTESAGVLYFATGGVNKMKLDASGNLTCVGDVTAFGTI